MSDLKKYLRPEIVDMAPYKPGEQPGAAKVIKLNTNENPYPPSPKVREAIVHATDRLRFGSSRPICSGSAPIMFCAATAAMTS